jgi:hypothetical protein
VDLLQADRLRPKRKRRPNGYDRKRRAGRARVLDRTFRALPLMVPDQDWSEVLAGAKTEWRRLGQPRAPRVGPVVLYRIHPATEEIDSRPGILEETWTEPLGAISAESLEREGFADLGEFRRYMDARYPSSGYRPLTMARVYRVRLWRPEDTPQIARDVLTYLYGDLVP